MITPPPPKKKEKKNTYKAAGNTLRNEENAINQCFLLFLLCFLSYQRLDSFFQHFFFLEFKCFQLVKYKIL